MNNNILSSIQLNKEDLKFDEKVSKALREIEKNKQIETLAEKILEKCKISEGYSDSLIVEKYFDYSAEWRELIEKSNDSAFRIECHRKVKEKMLLQMTDLIEEVLKYANSVIDGYELCIGKKEIAQGTGGKNFQYQYKFTIIVKKDD